MSKFAVGARLSTKWTHLDKKSMGARLETQKQQLIKKCLQIGIDPNDRAITKALIDNIYEALGDETTFESCRMYLGKAIYYNLSAWQIFECDGDITIAEQYFIDASNAIVRFEKMKMFLRVEPLVEKARKFNGGRKKGSIKPQTKHIRDLVKENPDTSAKELYKLADKLIIAGMSQGTFSNQVTAARKALKSVFFTV